MCGGIVSALSLGGAGKAPGWRHQLAYNLGRISSYGAIGALAGAAGASSLLLDGVLPVQQTLYLAANLMLLALGLSLAGVWHGVVRLERAGALVWRRLAPWSRRLFPLTTPARALAAGVLWGFVPCGLVYSVLFTALVSGSAVKGATAMLAFGMGTLPNLVAMGFFAGRLQPWLQKRPLRLAAGSVVAGFGVLGLIRFGTAPLGLAGFCRV